MAKRPTQTVNPDLLFRNNIPNTTVSGTGDYNQSTITVVGNLSGYALRDVVITYYSLDTYSFAEQTAQISSDGNTATATIYNFDDLSYIDVDGTYQPGTTPPTPPPPPTPTLTLTNNVGEDTTATYDYDGTTATITLTTPNRAKWRLRDVTATYVDQYGATHVAQMNISGDGSYIATCVITDIDDTQAVIINGTYTEVVTVEYDLANCVVVGDAPTVIERGATLTVTLRANENTEFQSETANYIYWVDGLGYYGRIPLTISEDKQTVSGSFTLSTEREYTTVTVIGESSPIAVIGGNYGAINVYCVTLDNLSEFSTKRFFVENIGGDTPQYESVDLGQFVNRIHRVFCNVPTLSSDVIKCGKYNTQITAFAPKNDVITLDFGDVEITAHNNDNTDYQSELQMFLPFKGFISIPNDYVGKTLNLQYSINIISGGGVARISYNNMLVRVEEITPFNDIIYKTSNNITIGGDDWNDYILYGIEPYVIQKYFISKSDNRNSDSLSTVIGDMRGFVVFDDVYNIETQNATEDEIKQIVNELTSGVYIN